ncbi:MAG: hypothetical protein HY297_04460 [Thaumarchaeota archaeon]|nr:hypothetical protein [Nitrososphaerota archaeon]
MQSAGEGWESVALRLRVVSLTWIVRVLVPSLLVSSLPKRTRGISFHSGVSGMAVGFVVVAGSIVIGWLLGGSQGPLGAAVSFWLLGSTGLVMVASSLRPLAFVKPICVRCRLLPVIREHESIHLAGVSREETVWASMRLRHSTQSLALEADPAICWFCPIPKRLAGH